MYYDVHRPQGPRIPGIVALLVVVTLFSVAIKLFSPNVEQKKPQQATIPIERAEVANIRDNTVTIYWQTKEPSEGYIMYGASQSDISQKIFDRRDIATKPIARRNHIVTLANLQSNTSYFYNVFINDAPVGQTADIPFQFKTARYLKNPSGLDPIIGKIIENEGKVSSEAIVLIYIGSAHPLLAQAKEDGSFAISPCCIFNSATYEPILPSKTENVIVEVIDERGLSKKISTTLGNIDSITSVIALNQDSKDTSKGVILGETDSSVLQMAEDVQNVAAIDIIYPKENALIPGSRPLIKGTGIPDASVRISLEPSGRIFETTITKNKIWQFQPTFDLDAGKYTLNVATQDEQGAKVYLQRSFMIEKNGESVLGDATPSATLTPIATPTAELITETPLPTEVLPTAMPSLPKTGSSILPFGIASMALVIIGAGMIFLL